MRVCWGVRGVLSQQSWQDGVCDEIPSWAFGVWLLGAAHSIIWLVPVEPRFCLCQCCAAAFTPVVTFVGPFFCWAYLGSWVNRVVAASGLEHKGSDARFRVRDNCGVVTIQPDVIS